MTAQDRQRLPPAPGDAVIEAAVAIAIGHVRRTRARREGLPFEVVCESRVMLQDRPRVSRLAHRLIRLTRALDGIAADDLPLIQDMLEAWLDDRRAGQPPSWPGLDVRSMAEHWADFADAAEIEAYAAAALRRVERRHFGRGARKRILAAMWQSLDREDRLAFIQAVAPRAAAYVD